VRRRDSLLEALLLFRSLSARVSVNEILAFLYTCENEGLSVQELAYVAEISQSAASRSVRALGPAGSPWSKPPALGLVQAFLHPSDGRSHLLHLTEEGERLRDRLDEIIRRSVTILQN
jgi:DNA-binding MarR family transcriptional regulator